MGLTLGDILLRFRAESREVDSAFTRVEQQANAFAQRMRGLLALPITGATAQITAAIGGAEGQAVGFAQRMQGQLALPFTGNLTGLDGALGGAEGAVASWSGRVKGFIAAALVVPAGNFMVDMVMQGASMVSNSVIGMNASLESTTLQFTTLMKDADLAKQHVKDLFIFAKDTPFETMPIIAASRNLQTFGGNALNTKEHLRAVGDAAAAVSQDIGRVAFWYGRMNNAIKGGTAWGEAGMVLQEMGVLTADTRTKMENMKQSGADGAAIWAVFAAQMQTFDGAMLRMAGTWSGLTSTIADSVNISGATIFKGVFDLAKEALMVVTSLLGSTRFDAFVANAAAAVTRLTSNIQTGIEAVLPIAALVWGTFEPLLSIAWEWGSGFINAFAGGISAAVGFVADALGGLATMITGLLEPHSPPKILPNLDKWGLKAAQVWMGGWKQADYSVFESIGQSVSAALQNAVGMGKLKETSDIPMLATVKGSVAELLAFFNRTGQISADILDKMRVQGGPAG